MTPTQLKDWVRNRARTSGVNPQLIMRYYMLDRLHLTGQIHRGLYNRT